MPKYEPPRDFRHLQATRDDIKSMTRMVKHRNTCPWCKTVYITHDGSRQCEGWHQKMFRQQRADLLRAIEKAMERGERKDAERLAKRRRAIPDA